MIITLDQATIYFLILSRFIGLIMNSPFFNSKQLFVFGKMALCIWASGLMIFVIPLTPNVPESAVGFVFAMVSEFLIGMMIGFVANLLVTGIEMAGALMDTQAGLSVASLLDPSSGRNASLFEQLLKWISVMMFLMINGHHMVLSSVYQSFYLLPVGAPVDMTEGARYLITMGKDIFIIAVQLSAPILLIVFLVDFAFGMLNRVAEQINIFQLGFQLKPIVSTVIFLAITPGIVYSVMSILEDLMNKIIKLMVLFQV